MDKLNNSMKLSDVNVDDYSALFIPGGHGEQIPYPILMLGLSTVLFASCVSIFACAPSPNTIEARTGWRRLPVCFAPAGVMADGVQAMTPIIEEFAKKVHILDAHSQVIAVLP